MKVFTMTILIVLAAYAVGARDKAPFSVCVPIEELPSPDDKKQYKRLADNIESRFTGPVELVEFEKCASDLIAMTASIAMSQENSGSWLSNQSAVVDLQILGKRDGEVVISQTFEAKQGRFSLSRGITSGKGNATKNAVKKFHTWADENRDAIAQKLGITIEARKE